MSTYAYAYIYEFLVYLLYYVHQTTTAAISRTATIIVGAAAASEKTAKIATAVAAFLLCSSVLLHLVYRVLCTAVVYPFQDHLVQDFFYLQDQAR